MVAPATLASTTTSATEIAADSKGQTDPLHHGLIVECLIPDGTAISFTLAFPTSFIATSVTSASLAALAAPATVKSAAT